MLNKLTAEHTFSSKVNSFNVSSKFHQSLLSVVNLFFLFLLFLFTILKAKNLNINHWETVINAEDEWHHHTSISNPGNNWGQKNETYFNLLENTILKTGRIIKI